jgi:hypothetical protein
MSKQFLIDFLPWLLSANTLYVMFLAGNKNKYTWILGLIGQVLWLVWIILTESWGLIPMNIGLWVVYARNHLKWRKK